MRKQLLTALLLSAFLSAIVLPVGGQVRSQTLEQLLEERFLACRRMQSPLCSPLVSVAEKARIQRTDESIRRLYPDIARQFDRQGWPSSPDLELQAPESAPVELDPINPPESAQLNSLPGITLPASDIAEDNQGAAGLSEGDSGSEPDTAPAEIAAPLPAGSIEFTLNGHHLSYGITDTAEILLGTYLPGDIAPRDTLFLFHFRNTSDHPVDISTDNFRLVDEDTGKSIKIKTGREANAPANPFSGIGRAFNGLLRNAAHFTQQPGASFRYSNHPAQSDSWELAVTSSSSPGIAEDYQDRILWIFQELVSDRSDWSYWIQSRLLTETVVQPGEEILRFVPAGRSARAHRHVLTFRCEASSLVLNTAEKSLR